MTRARNGAPTTGYELFKNKLDDCVKVVLKPGMTGGNDWPKMAVV